MKIDLEKVKEVGLTIEETLVLVNIEYIRRGMILAYKSLDQGLYVKLVEDSVLSVTPDGYSITTDGYQKFRAITGQKLLVLKEDATKYNFDEFWSVFPNSDQHGDWLKTRILKSDKEGSRAVYRKAIKNGDITHTEMIKALRWQIKQFKLKSITSNRMSFMKNSKTWLNQREYGIILETYTEEDTDEAPDNWTNTVV